MSRRQCLCEIIIKPTIGPFTWPLFLILLNVFLISLKLFGWITVAWIEYFELLAIVDTTITFALFFFDLMISYKDEKMAGLSQLVLGAAIIMLVFVIIVVLILLFNYTLAPRIAKVFDTDTSVIERYMHLMYFYSVVFLFFLFTVIDWMFAMSSQKFKNTRNYWELFCFVDGPAACAFFFMGILYIARILEFDHIVGAIIMQMFLANILFLMSTTNIHRRILHNWYKTATM